MKNKLIYIWITLLCYTANAQVSDFEHINFTKADLIAKQHQGHHIDNLPILSYQLTHKLTTPVEKFRSIYTWVCTNIKGDLAQQNKVERKRKKYNEATTTFLQWNDNFKKKSFQKLRRHKRTVCTGYAYLIKELCFLANIECVIINGYARTVNSNTHKLKAVNHSWNAVKVNQKWYLCDATWSSGYFNNSNEFVQTYNDGYFLTNPVLFHKNHYPTQEKWLLDTNQNKEAFINFPLMYCDAFKYKALPISPTKMKFSAQKNSTTKFCIQTSNTSYKDKISLIYFLGNREVKMDIFNLVKQHNKTTFDYKFRHLGIQDIHLKINNDIVATYTAKIHK